MVSDIESDKHLFYISHWTIAQLIFEFYWSILFNIRGQFAYMYFVKSIGFPFR